MRRGSGGGCEGGLLRGRHKCAARRWRRVLNRCLQNRTNILLVEGALQTGPHVASVAPHTDSAPQMRAEIISMHDQRGHKLCRGVGRQRVAAHNTVARASRESRHAPYAPLRATVVDSTWRDRRLRAVQYPRPQHGCSETRRHADHSEHSVQKQVGTYWYTAYSSPTSQGTGSLSHSSSVSPACSSSSPTSQISPPFCGL